ncbi:MAG: threonine synthase [Lentisphaerae bacterium]|nr:threonine synthase [Lentisphaerota bacterium]MBT4820791.1 threonine synthase [Lentisphaerota bacterium]MBT5610164.1 threonine synthase [Lentisphaerota bacterium]MBT7057103.1 threonine synthase [Lentisphaerota bacterium]MBT7846174.1 threonine synthase [Lentisphaerota bacterium]
MNESALYSSTRGQISPVPFREAVLMGLATDGGLLLPNRIPDVEARLDSWRELPYPALAAAVMRPFIDDSIDDGVLDSLVQRSYATFTAPDVVPIRAVGDVHICELFHGPTLAFKDIALQFLGNLFEHLLAETDSSLNIVGATSGDTGSAAIEGVRGRANMHIFIMHPHGRVSPVQERQMTSVLDKNVHNIAVKGTFDDGQRVLKEIFNDISFKDQFRLGAVNSVNWARVLAQIVYYFHATFRVQESTGAERVQVAVPTGNFGDIFAGYVARRMGAPISRLILATNENDILARFFNTGVYQRGTVEPTLSPSMDIQVASNFERYLYYRVGCDGANVRALMSTFQETGRFELERGDSGFVAGRGTTADTLATIRKYHQEYGYLLDPHTAVGVAIGERFLSGSEPTVCLATAHPAKFGAAITEAVGEDIARHPIIDGLLDLPTRCVVLPAEKDAVQTFMRETLAG